MSTASRSRPSAPLSRISQEDHLPPIYEAPAHPLNDSAQRTLQNLLRAHDLQRLKSHLKAVNDTLSNAAADINDRSYQRQFRLQKAKAKRQQHGLDDTEEDQQREKACEKMKAEVQDLTAKMEQKVRATIDAEAHVQAVEDGLGEVHGNVVAGGGIIAPTQSTLGASQFRQRRRVVRSDSEEEDDVHSDGGQENVGPTGLLKRKLEEHDTRYEGLTLRTRYTILGIPLRNYHVDSLSVGMHSTTRTSISDDWCMMLHIPEQTRHLYPTHLHGFLRIHATLTNRVKHLPSAPYLHKTKSPISKSHQSESLSNVL